MKCFNVTSKVR